MEGWIKIDRKLRKHWIWNDDKKLKWWLTILMEVNFEDKKVLIGNHVYDCKRGESVMSLRTWAKLFNTTPKTVKTFFLLLSNDSIIETRSIGISTHLKVCNYDSYQDSVNAKYTPLTTQSKQQLPTTKERKESKELKNNIYKGKKSEKFIIPPKLEWIKEYCQQRENKVDPEKFYAHYESNGWMVGKTKMIDWQSAVITWEKNKSNYGNNSRSNNKGTKSVNRYWDSQN